MSPLHQSLHFVPLFPMGQLGWNPKLPLSLEDEDDAPDVDDGGQLLQPGEEPPPGGQVIARRKKCKNMSQIEYFSYRLFLARMSPTTYSRLATSSRSTLLIHGQLQSNHA